MWINIPVLCYGKIIPEFVSLKIDAGVAVEELSFENDVVSCIESVYGVEKVAITVWPKWPKLKNPCGVALEGASNVEHRVHHHGFVQKGFVGVQKDEFGVVAQVHGLYALRQFHHLAGCGVPARHAEEGCVAGGRGVVLEQHQVFGLHLPAGQCHHPLDSHPSGNGEASGYQSFCGCAVVKETMCDFIHIEVVLVRPFCRTVMVSIALVVPFAVVVLVMAPEDGVRRLRLHRDWQHRQHEHKDCGCFFHSFVIVYVIGYRPLPKLRSGLGGRSLSTLALSSGLSPKSPCSRGWAPLE